MTQFGRRLTCSPPLAMEKLVHIDYRVTPQYVIHRTGQLMGEDGERFALALFFLQAGQRFLADRIMPETASRRCRKRPRAIGIADRRA